MKCRIMVVIALGLVQCGSSGCALMMFGPGHEGGSATLSDAASAARPDTGRKVREPRELDVGYPVVIDNDFEYLIEDAPLGHSQHFLWKRL